MCMHTCMHGRLIWHHVRLWPGRLDGIRETWTCGQRFSVGPGGGKGGHFYIYLMAGIYPVSLNRSAFRNVPPRGRSLLLPNHFFRLCMNCIWLWPLTDGCKNVCVKDCVKPCIKYMWINLDGHIESSLLHTFERITDHTTSHPWRWTVRRKMTTALWLRGDRWDWLLPNSYTWYREWSVYVVGLGNNYVHTHIGVIGGTTLRHEGISQA